MRHGSSIKTQHGVSFILNYFTTQFIMKALYLCSFPFVCIQRGNCFISLAFQGSYSPSPPAPSLENRGNAGSTVSKSAIAVVVS